MPAASPSAAAARAPQPPARHASRTAMTANPPGSTSWNTHDGMPSAISPPTSISMATTSTADQASNAVTAAATVAANARVARRMRPSVMKLAVASAISLFSRAASAAPRKATQRVRC